MLPWRRAVPGAVALALAGLQHLMPLAPVEFEERGLLYPAQRLAGFFDKLPPISPDLRLLVMDDLSMLGMKRVPTIDELVGLGKRLLESGYETVLISGVTLEAEGNGAELGTVGQGKILGIGAVAYPPERKSNMAQPAADFDPAMFVKDNGPRKFDGRPTAGSLLAPKFKQGVGVVQYGALNTDSDAQVPAVFEAGSGLVMPHLALLASPRFLLDPAGFLVRAKDEKVYVDFLRPEAIAGAAVRLGPILQGGPLPDKLTGGKVALIVPDGHTGSRFVRSPTGLVPSYFALASLVSSNMLDRAIINPRRPGVFKVVCIAALLLILAFGPASRSLSLGAAWIFLCYAAAIVFASRGKRFVPGASTVVIMSTAWLVAMIQSSLQSFAARVKLSSELDLGSAVQKLFLPDASSWKFGNWTIEIQHKAYGALSGDWFQVYVPESGSHFAVVAIGDVVGKGASAALITAGIATLWADVAVEWDKGRIDVNGFLRRLDHVIEVSFKNQQYTTLCLAVLTPDEVITISAAAPQWLIVHDDWTTESVRTRATQPLGMKRDTRLEDVSKTHQMTAPATLVAYTDGLFDGSKARTYIRNKLAQKKETGTPFSPAELAAEIWAPVPQDIAPLADDATMVMLRYEP